MPQQTIDPSQIARVCIYPPIGIARVGNSVENDGWFYGPEVPGRFDEPAGGFKDAHGAVKRQAARFRVFALSASEQVLCEVTKENGFELDWDIEVANRKASWYTFMGSQQPGAFQPGYTTLRNPTVQPDLPPEKRTKLIVTSGIEHVSSTPSVPRSPSNTLPHTSSATPLVGQFYGSKDKPTDIYLGEASTDEQGHLVFKAGRGKSMSIAQEGDEYPLIMNDFDSSDWIDDTCDGVVGVVVRHVSSGKSFTPAARARVIGTTPKFASGIYAPTSLYDLIEEVYEREKRKEAKKEGKKYTVGEVEWYRHIWPLLERPPLLSWVNIQANEGHGPNGPGNFYDEHWQKVLSDRSTESEAVRRGVLGRMRLPSTNDEYDQARVGQAYPYFMPWLSGDNGRTTAGDPSTFASITELQYDRLAEWAKGRFQKSSTKPPPPPSTIEELPIQAQPAALTKAALEPTIGAPLYPGIEMSWNAELSETYDLKSPFTVSKDVQPGDLTKYLSLPWQSDFYMCRSYWWPSARPDSIVTEKLYLEVVKSVKPVDIAKKLDHRVPWERGIHQNYTDVFGDQPLFANTDMAQRWHKLGFIVQRPSSGPEPIFVETQRGDLKKADIQGRPVRTNHGGGITLPTPHSVDIPINTIESLKEHLQTAMAVELSTIPLYLSAMYSVKTPAAHANDPRYYDPIVGAVRGVVAEEMLHLSLAGNILLAVGGTPKLYDPDIIPSYPMLMPGRIPKLTLHLRKLTKENLDTFLGVEKPEEKGAPPESGPYHTLGQFYDAINKGLDYLNEKEKSLFKPETAPYQFAPGLGYQPHIHDAGGSVVITNLATAKEAIKTIVHQGEGADGEFDDPEDKEKAHYYIFKDLKDGKETWDVYPTQTDPTTVGYWEKDKKIYQVSVAFDAAYCFLLLTIEKLWSIESDNSRHKLVLGNMFSIMMGVLSPLAKFLVQQPIGAEGEVASPCFGYYHFDKNSSALKQLQHEMQSAIDAYVSVTAENQDQVVIHNYGPQLELLLPIQQTINALLDLDTFVKLQKPVVKQVQPGVQTRGAKGFARGF